MFTAKDKLEDKFFSVSLKKVFINGICYQLKTEILVPEYMDQNEMLVKINQLEPIAYRVNYVLSDLETNDLVSIFEISRLDNCLAIDSVYSLDQCYELLAKINSGCSIPYTELKENFLKLQNLKNNSPINPSLISIRGLNGRVAIQEDLLNQVVINSQKLLSLELYSQPGTIFFSHKEFKVSNFSDFVYIPPINKKSFGLNLFSFCLQ